MLEVIVLNKKIETPDISSFELALKDGSELPSFEAGSHVDVHVNADMVRPYSLINNPDDRATYKIAVLKDPNSRGGSRAVHETLHAGDTIRISAPRNLFPLNTESRRVLLFAGGIGITPLMSMASVLEKLGCDFELHYHCRSKESAAFGETLENGDYGSQVFFHFDDDSNDDAAAVKEALSQPSQDVHLYTCGPNGFMDYIFDTAKSLGWQQQNLHKEVFNAAPVELSSGEKSFELHLQRSGITLLVPQDKTALEIIEAAGIEIDVSCEQGICGACLTNITAGIPDHRDDYLSDDEKSKNDQFTPCCSRALTDSLSIDL